MSKICPECGKSFIGMSGGMSLGSLIRREKRDLL